MKKVLNGKNHLVSQISAKISADIRVTFIPPQICEYLKTVGLDLNKGFLFLVITDCLNVNLGF